VLAKYISRVLQKNAAKDTIMEGPGAKT
jgi:hypothetical protein